jgi:hypothetical protein
MEGRGMDWGCCRWREIGRRNRRGRRGLKMNVWFCGKRRSGV